MREKSNSLRRTLRFLLRKTEKEEDDDDGIEAKEDCTIPNGHEEPVTQQEKPEESTRETTSKPKEERVFSFREKDEFVDSIGIRSQRWSYQLQAYDNNENVIFVITPGGRIVSILPEHYTEYLVLEQKMIRNEPTWLTEDQEESFRKLLFGDRYQKENRPTIEMKWDV